MAATGKEKELNESFGAPMEEWLPMLLRLHKSPYRVAVALGVYPNTVRHWMKKIGLIEKAEGEQETNTDPTMRLAALPE